MNPAARALLPSPDKPVAVLGAGRSGRAAARLLARSGFKPIVFDTGTGDALAGVANELAREGIACVTGAAAGAPDRDYSLAILSPGIAPESPMACSFKAAGALLLSEIELAWSLSSAPVIAITGTNGKTTTTALTAHLFQKANRCAPACGNIGDAFSDAVRRFPKADVYILEISSFQLETCFQFRPEVAVWTNFSPNHLDRYGSIEEYRAAKLRIFQNQTRADFAVVRAEDIASGVVPAPSARLVTFSATPGAQADFTLDAGWILFRGERVIEQAATSLRGRHNAENLMAALASAECLGLDAHRVAENAVDFVPPEHRCETVLERNGVLWINDSKSTTLDSLEKALRSQERPVVLIAGGKDKGFSFAPVASCVKQHVVFAVLIGQTKEKIAKDWLETPSAQAQTLEEAVGIAARVAKPGMVVLFSPGTSSFDMFTDFEERGRRFKESVLAFYSNVSQTYNKQPTS